MPDYSFKASDGIAFRFTDIAQLLDFVTQEIEAWSWLSRFTHSNPGQQLYQHIVTPLSNAQNYLREQTPSPEVIAALTPQIQAYLSIEPAVHAKGHLRNHLSSRVSTDPSEAIYMLATIYQKRGVVTPFGDNYGGGPTFVSGITLAVGFLEGWKESDKASSASNAAKSSAVEASNSAIHARESQAQADETAKRLHVFEQEIVKSLQGTHDQIRSDDVQLRDQLRAAMESAIDRLNTEWKAVTATYDTQLALKAPASYWSTKKQSHSRWVTWLSVLTICVAIFGAICLYNLADVVFGNLKVGTLPTWLQAISFSMGGVIYLWTLRSLLRFLLSHAHLALDAAERQTMIISYLALIRKQGIKAEALDQVFTSIFRPSGDGIVKDEGIPLPSLLEMIARR